AAGDRRPPRRAGKRRPWTGPRWAPPHPWGETRTGRQRPGPPNDVRPAIALAGGRAGERRTSFARSDRPTSGGDLDLPDPGEPIGERVRVEVLERSFDEQLER